MLVLLPEKHQSPEKRLKPDHGMKEGGRMMDRRMHKGTGWCRFTASAAWMGTFLIIVFYATASPAFSFFEPDIRWNPEGSKAAKLLEMNPEEQPEIMEKLVSIPYAQSSKYFPEKKGLGRGGFPLAVADVPQSDTKAGLFIRDPDTRHGFIYRQDMTIVVSFELTGESPRYIQSLAFPTTKMLMVSGDLPVEKGVFRKGLFQYDWQSKKLISVLSRDLFYNPASYSFNGETGLTIFHEGRKWIYINMERPRYAVMVYFSSVYPRGIELFRMSYAAGAVRKVFQANKKTFYFLTERDYILFETSRRLWKLTLQ